METAGLTGLTVVVEVLATATLLPLIAGLHAIFRAIVLMETAGQTGPTVVEVLVTVILLPLTVELHAIFRATVLMETAGQIDQTVVEEI